jgi:hypothetical protein
MFPNYNNVYPQIQDYPYYPNNTVIMNPMGYPNNFVNPNPYYPINNGFNPFSKFTPQTSYYNYPSNMMYGAYYGQGAMPDPYNYVNYSKIDCLPKERPQNNANPAAQLLYVKCENNDMYPQQYQQLREKYPGYE